MAPARLLVQLPTERWLSLPVPRQACLGLTRAVVFVTRRLASGRPEGISDGSAGDDWRDACWRLAGTSPSTAVWLVTAERRLAVMAAGQAESSQLRLWLELLRADLLLQPRAAANAPLRAALPVPEAVLNGLARGYESAGMVQPGGIVSRAVAGGWLEQLDHWAGKPDAAAQSAGQPAGATPLGSEADPMVLLLEEALLGATAVEGLAAEFDARVATARLDSIRELAYGAGHEINNPLANIAARAQALLPDEADPERRRRLATIVDQAFRARDMIGGLMIFARPPRPQPAATPLATLIANVVESLAPVAERHGVRLVYSRPPIPLTVLVDGSQVEESLRAVVLNGIEAIAGGGTVNIEATAADRVDGKTCRVTVTDNGAGMSRETVERMFDPFFSGREAGRGIGLGLSKAVRLIDANGGRMTVTSRPQQGTTVTVSLPLNANGPQSLPSLPSVRLDGR